MNWYLKAFKQYTDFKGRARRKEYWMFTLFQIIFIILAVIIDNVIGLTFSPETPYGWFYLLLILGTFLPSLAVSVRRLHDIGKSGWWYLISLIPIVGSIWIIVLYCTDSENGSNKWGKNPKEVTNDYTINQIGKE